MPGSPYLDYPRRTLEEMSATLALQIAAKRKRVEAAEFVENEARRAREKEARELETLEARNDWIEEARAHHLRPHLVLAHGG